MEVKISKTLKEAIDFLSVSPNAKILAGGTDLMVGLNGKAAPDELVLVSIGDLQELKEIRETADGIEIGALVTDTMLCESELVKHKVQAVWQAAYQSAGPQVRNRATVGGNIGTASPAADVLCALLAHQAEVQILGPEGLRVEQLKGLITGPKKTALKNNELIVKVIIKESASAFHKLGKRKAVTISIANCSASVRLDGDNIAEISAIAGSVASTPVSLAEVEKALTGQKVSRKLVEEKALLADASISPITDQRATAWYRRQIVPVLAARAILDACKKGGWVE